MSVLIEALCLVVPNRVLDVSYPGGTTAFIDEVNMRADVRYAVTDGRLSAVSMFDNSVGIQLADALEEFGIVGADGRVAVEFAFVDMQTGSSLPCDWLETAHHPHGFMIARGAGHEPGHVAVPGDWDPSVSWKLERTDVGDDPERGTVLAWESGFTTLLDFKSGYVHETLDTQSPVVPVGREQAHSPAQWQLVPGLPASLQCVQQVLQRVGIPFHVEQHLGAIRIPFACDVTVHHESGQQEELEIRQRVLVTAGPGEHDITCTTVLPLRVPVRLRSEAARIAQITNMLCHRLQMDFEPATGTVAMITITNAGERPLTEDATERAIAASSPVAGSCYEELVEWMEDRVGYKITALNMSAHQPTE